MSLHGELAVGGNKREAEGPLGTGAPSEWMTTDC